ncbi:winged helix-turn-helix domain-containing protein [candidate division KSB1 bacterium]|nr:winged helix-turn-helix domain-containing protein [candidate division KSB1 bacterium]
MIPEIGEQAGAIWHILNANGEMTLAQIKKETEVSDFLITTALGWLAREGKINITKSGKSVKVSLK